MHDRRKGGFQPALPTSLPNVPPPPPPSSPMFNAMDLTEKIRANAELNETIGLQKGKSEMLQFMLTEIRKMNVKTSTEFGQPIVYYDDLIKILVDAAELL